MSKRIVITGLGVLSSIGNGKNSFWNALTNGKSGVGRISIFNPEKFKIKNAYEIKELDLKHLYNEKSVKRIKKMGRASQFAIMASKMALLDAELDLNDKKTSKIGIAIGSGLGDGDIFEQLCEKLNNEKINNIKNNQIDNYNEYSKEIIDEIYRDFSFEALGKNIAIEVGLKGENYVFGSACAAGNYSIGYAYDLIKNGECDIMLAGGTDSFSKSSLAYMSRVTIGVTELCQPFDMFRRGMMFGEGSGIVVLESLESALERKADIYGEVLSYGLSCDAYHTTIPEVNGMTRVIQNAISNANIKPEDIDYICAHGTGTVLNDKNETEAIKRAYGNFTYSVPISSIKSMIGHTSGASGAIAVIATLLAMKNSKIPPTIHQSTKDPECDLDYVPNVARQKTINLAQVNSFGFGGNNCSIILKKEVKG